MRNRKGKWENRKNDDNPITQSNSSERCIYSFFFYLGSSSTRLIQDYVLFIKITIMGVCRNKVGYPGSPILWR